MQKTKRRRSGASSYIQMQLLIHRRTVGSGSDRDRALQRESDDGFRPQDNLLALVRRRNAGSCACAGSCADRGAFTTAEDTAQDRAYGCAAADLRCCRLAAGVAGLGPLAGLQVVTASV